MTNLHPVPSLEDEQAGRFLHLESFAGMDWDTPEYVWEPDVDGKPHGAMALGSLVLAAGRPGAGKSSWGRWTAAQVSRGTLPGIWAGTPHGVAYIAGEESLKYNVIPSLIAAGADMEKVFHPRVDFIAPDGEIEHVALVPEKDMRELTALLIAHGVKLVIVDPLMEFMGTNSDVYKNNEVRAKLKPWSKLAEDIDGVVIAITHLNKSGNGDVVAGINGSSAFGEVARAVFGFTKDPDSEDGDRIMSQEKNSVGTEGAAWVYRIQGQEITNTEGKRGEFGTFVMIGDSDRTVGEVLRDASLNPGGDGGTGGVKAFVLDLLKSEDGVAPAAKIKSEVTEAGYSWKTVQNNRGKWGIETVQVAGGWVWSLIKTDPDQHTDPHIPGSRDLGSGQVNTGKSDPTQGQIPDPTRRDLPGSPPTQSRREPATPTQDNELRDLVLGSLHPEHPMGLRTVEQSVPRHHRDQVADILHTLTKSGLVTENNNRYILTHNRKVTA